MFAYLEGGSGLEELVKNYKKEVPTILNNFLSFDQSAIILPYSPFSQVFLLLYTLSIQDIVAIIYKKEVPQANF